MSDLTAFSNTERQRQIEILLERQQRLTVARLCELFQISPSTARRDLDVLSGQGKIQRVRGGAVVLRQSPPEPPVLQRSVERLDEKRRIAQAAAQLIAPGETIYLSSGSSALELARLLPGRGNLTVLTNSLLVINLLAQQPGITLIALGGIFRPSELSFVGHLTEHALAELRADKVFIGVRAIDIEHGLTNDFLPETMTDRAILQIGRQVIVLADHTKLGRIATAFVASVTAMHLLITDRAASPEMLLGLTERGIRVLRV